MLEFLKRLGKIRPENIIPSVSAKTVQWAGPWRILIGYLNIRSSLIG